MSTSTRKVLFVMSEAAQIVGKDGKSREAGYWLEEFAIPYQMMKASGWHVDIATPLGEKPTADPASFAVDNDGKCHLWPDDKTFRTALATKESAIDNGQVLSLRNLPDRFFTAYDGVFFSRWLLPHGRSHSVQTDSEYTFAISCG